MSELRICPFCGGKRTRPAMRKGRTFINGLDETIEQHKWYIQCCKCKARGPIASGKVNLYENKLVSEERRKKFPTWQTTDRELKEAAMNKWNQVAGILRGQISIDDVMGEVSGGG